MLSEPPIFEVVGDGELSDAAIEALAALLLDAADRAGQAEPSPLPAEPVASQSLRSKRRRRVPSKEAQRSAK